jgi:hypothetical protein
MISGIRSEKEYREYLKNKRAAWMAALSKLVDMLWIKA